MATVPADGNFEYERTPGVLRKSRAVPPILVCRGWHEGRVSEDDRSEKDGPLRYEMSCHPLPTIAGDKSGKKEVMTAHLIAWPSG